MKVGDLVRTRVPGFGTGKQSKIGTVINETFFANEKEAALFEVLHDDGSFCEWYTWQLEDVDEDR
jgi:hypothetical protein